MYLEENNKNLNYDNEIQLFDKIQLKPSQFIYPSEILDAKIIDQSKISEFKLNEQNV